MIIRNSTTVGRIDGASTISTDETALSDSRLDALEYDITHLTLASSLTDVNTTGVVNGSILKYDTATSKWIVATDSDTTPALADLTDVDVAGVTDGQLLAYNNTTSKWEPTNAGTAAVDSVNGLTGVVVLDTDDISEGTTNLYYTDARVQAISINELLEDTTPQLGGGLDLNTFNITGTGAIQIASSSGHSLSRRTTNDNNAVLVLSKDTTGAGDGLLLKSLLLFTAKNSTTEASIGSIWAEKTDATTGKQVTLSLYADNGTNRVDFLSAARNSSGVDTVNCLKPLAVTGSGTFSSALYVNVDRTTTTTPDSVLMTTKLPNTVDIVNYFTGLADYSATTLPASDIQSTVTFRILLPGETTAIIPGRLVNTWNNTTSTSEMQLRSYLVDGTNAYTKLTVNKNYASSDVPFKFPSISLTTYTGVTEAGMVLFDTDDSTLKCYDGSTWNALF